MHQLNYLQCRARNRLRINARLISNLNLHSHQINGGTPYINGHTVRWCFRMKCLVNFGIVDQITVRFEQLLHCNGTLPNNTCLSTQVETARNLTMAYHLSRPATRCTERHARTFTSGTHTLAIATGTGHLTLDTIWTRYGRSLGGRISIDRIGNRHPLLPNAIQHIGDFSANGVCNVLSLFLEEGFLFSASPIGYISAPLTGCTAFLGTSFALWTDDPATSGTRGT